MDMNQWIQAAKQENRNLLEHEAWALFSVYGIPAPAHRLAKTAGEAAEAAGSIGFPVALKVVSADVLHKSDAGGVRLALRDAASVKEAFSGIVEAVGRNVPGAKIAGVLVCEMCAPGLECIIGMTRDASFGPALMFGLGGIFVETLRDVSFRVLPFEKADALAMIAELKAAPLLTGTRGQPPKDVDAVADLLVKVARMVAENPEIRELDINPLFVYETGAAPVDARVML